MPVSAPSICTFAGCGTTTTSGSRCPAHPYEKQRSKTTSKWKYLYNSARWIKGRKQFLSKHPLCAECESKGIIEPANVVDHIVAHLGDVKLFFNMRNWRALCKPCHDRKTATSDGGFGNKRK